LLLVVFGSLFTYAAAIALTKSGYAMWLLGVRYATAVMPLVAAVSGMLMVKIANGRAAIWISLLLLFCFTKFAQLNPWLVWDARGFSLGGNEIVEPHVPTTTIDRYLPMELVLFVRDLTVTNPGTVAATVDLLRAEAHPGDVLIANYEFEPLYFYTGLPLGMTILPEYPIYAAARRRNLSEYCFSPDHVRWIVWRPAWDLTERDVFAEIQREVATEGGHLQHVRDVTETFWENRENIHFRRFSGGKYLFAWFPHSITDTTPEKFPPASIFRVEWPAD
jgi:hypothetical protein